MESLADIRIPRCLREAKKVVKKSVVTFVDASLKAYGTVVYLPCEYEDATVSCRLIASKTKVAPTINTAPCEHSRSIDGYCNVLLR